METLRELRLKKDIKLKEMAKMIGVSAPFYCHIEQGKRKLSYENAFLIAQILDKKPDEIFYDLFTKKDLFNK